MGEIVCSHCRRVYILDASNTSCYCILHRMHLCLLFFISPENCSSTFVYDYIWRKHPDLQLNITINRLEQNCRSIQKYSFMVCGGMCNSSSASVKTACCQPSNIRTKSVTFQCHPDVRRQREISIQFPHSCTCVPCNRWLCPFVVVVVVYVALGCYEYLSLAKYICTTAACQYYDFLFPIY